MSHLMKPLIWKPDEVVLQYAKDVQFKEFLLCLPALQDNYNAL